MWLNLKFVILVSKDFYSICYWLHNKVTILLLENYWKIVNNFEFWIDVIGLICNDLNVMCLNCDLLFFLIEMIKNLYDLFCYIILRNIYLL